jgi:hypothetical protein
MILDLGISRMSRVYASREWHKTFAWLPVYVGDRDWRWLEYVERRFDGWSNWYDKPVLPEYRALDE